MTSALPDPSGSYSHHIFNYSYFLTFVTQHNGSNSHGTLGTGVGSFTNRQYKTLWQYFRTSTYAILTQPEVHVVPVEPEQNDSSTRYSQMDGTST